MCCISSRNSLYPGPLRICAHTPADADTGTGLRVLLVADVLARVVEMRGRAVLMGCTGPRNALAAAAGIRPADAQGNAEEITEAFAGPPGVRLTTEAYEGGGAACLQIGEATLPATEGVDALAVRFLLLGHPYEEPVAVTADELGEADRTLARWRRAVATWAEQPSKAIPADLQSAARAALDSRLRHPGGPAPAARPGSEPRRTAGCQVRDLLLRRPRAGPGTRP